METLVLIPQELSLALRTGGARAEASASVWSSAELARGTLLYPFQGTIRIDKLHVYSYVPDSDRTTIQPSRCSNHPPTITHVVGGVRCGRAYHLLGNSSSRARSSAVRAYRGARGASYVAAFGVRCRALYERARLALDQFSSVAWRAVAAAGRADTRRSVRRSLPAARFCSAGTQEPN
ncbi:hypothetical protein EVAR_14659_1 [Eumeta japonica]|uniref:Uncharacterized protein n=1 Tax=Eumeta variegata TaxID=151549 RepID=A0A4C1U2C4_EUMVA|nr:hypothetical protein EVAR_14659_1 [Eumeta japonica]